MSLWDNKASVEYTVWIGISLLTPPPCMFTLQLSYLNIFEELDLKIEEDFFKANPHLGWFHNRVIIGTIVAPPQDDPSIVKVTCYLLGVYTVYTLLIYDF